MPASSSFLRGLAASLAAPALVVAIALASASSKATNWQLSLCSLAPPFALAAATAFFSVAAYVTLAEHPARIALTDDTAALLQWKPSYKRAAAIQAPLAGAAALLGALCWRRAAAESGGGGGGVSAADPLWLLGACAAAFNLPYTLVVILPTNNVLLSSSKGTSETRKLLARWGHLHFLRTVAGGVAAASFLVALAGSRSPSPPSTTLAGSLSSWGPVSSLRQLLRLSKSDYGL